MQATAATEPNDFNVRFRGVKRTLRHRLFLLEGWQPQTAGATTSRLIVACETAPTQ
jgi:hypothetical protein